MALVFLYEAPVGTVRSHFEAASGSIGVQVVVNAAVVTIHASFSTHLVDVDVAENKDDYVVAVVDIRSMKPD